METTKKPEVIQNNVRIKGRAFPAYLNGRPRDLLIEAFGPSPRPEARMSTQASQPTPLADDFRKAGATIGQGVPFAALYMMRSKKKLALFPTAA